MPEPQDGCVVPAKGPISGSADADQTSQQSPETGKEAQKVLARVGKPAPDFEASAFVDGGFRNVRLSEYQGKWVILCFYPGDFTFV